MTSASRRGRSPRRADLRRDTSARKSRTNASTSVKTYGCSDFAKLPMIALWALVVVSNNSLSRVAVEEPVLVVMSASLGVEAPGHRQGVCYRSRRGNSAQRCAGTKALLARQLGQLPRRAKASTRTRQAQSDQSLNRS